MQYLLTVFNSEWGIALASTFSPLLQTNKYWYTTLHWFSKCRNVDLCNVSKIRLSFCKLLFTALAGKQQIMQEFLLFLKEQEALSLNRGTSSPLLLSALPYPAFLYWVVKNSFGKISQGSEKWCLHTYSKTTSNPIFCHVHRK